MQASRNALRENRILDVTSGLVAVKQWAKRNVTNERIARNGLAFAGAVSMCYLGVRIFQGVQNYVAYTY